MSRPSDPFSQAGSPPPVAAELAVTVDRSLGAAAPDLDLSFLAPPLEPGELGWLAHYRVLKVLGRGGMGVVFQAEDTHLLRTVALKAILPEFAAHPQARERFLREARAAAAIKNDHVVTIYQVGQDRDVPFIAMECLAGQTLEDRLNEGPLPLEDTLRLGRQIADGLKTAHDQGLIHRDIKPANIWLEAPSGRVKLLDFGLARTAGTHGGLTQAGSIVGSPEFMAPEQARGETLDARSDLFSLGIVLYCMAAGENPFQGSTTMAVLTALAVKVPPPLREVNPSVPAELSDLVDRLLKKDPAERPSSAGEVTDELRTIAGGRPLPPSGALSETRKIHTGKTRPTARPPSIKTQIAPPPATEKSRLGPVGIVAATLLAVMLFFVGWFWYKNHAGNHGAAASGKPSGTPIRVGILHSKSGTMAISERLVIDAVLFALDEINAKGGLLGRPVEAVVADGQSDEATFAAEATKLIEDAKVAAIFGCWTSASRKAVLPVVEKHAHLLFYPVQYEGLEQSPNIVYGGPTPHQQILPALRWMLGFENRRRWFLIGSDYVYPHAANAIIKDEAKARGCEIVGEEYRPLGGGGDATELAKKIAAAKPDLIINTINGDANVPFFRGLRRVGIDAAKVPTLSFSISEEELRSLGAKAIAGDYVAGNYFQTVGLPANQDFLKHWQAKHGGESVMSGAMETARNNVHLWAQAVVKAGKEDPASVLAAIGGLHLDSPQGPVRIDSATRHTIQIARVGKLDEQGRIKEVFLSPEPVAPEPYPPPRTKAEWNQFLEGLHQRWGGRWSNPGP